MTFFFHSMDSGVQVLDFSLCQWNVDSGFHPLVDSGFLELYSGFQSPGFHKQTFPGFFIPESGFPYLERMGELNGSSALVELKELI